MIAPRRKNFGDQVFFADVALGDMFDHHPGLRRNRCRRLSNAIPQRRRELRIVEGANLPRVTGTRSCRARGKSSARFP
jgi:hypothetical protein